MNRRLVQLSINGTALPSRGDKIVADECGVGEVTSTAHSVRLGKRLALGYVRREFVKTGTKLRINQQTAEILKLCGE